MLILNLSVGELGGVRVGRKRSGVLQEDFRDPLPEQPPWAGRRLDESIDKCWRLVPPHCGGLFGSLAGSLSPSSCLILLVILCYQQQKSSVASLKSLKFINTYLRTTFYIT